MEELTTKQKILKVIQFIYNLLSGLFIGFILTSLIIGGVKSNNGVELPKEQQSSLVEAPYKRNFDNIGSDVYLLSESDLLSTSVLYNLVKLWGTFDNLQYQQGKSVAVHSWYNLYHWTWDTLVYNSNPTSYLEQTHNLSAIPYLTMTNYYYNFTTGYYFITYNFHLVFNDSFVWDLNFLALATGVVGGFDDSLMVVDAGINYNSDHYFATQNPDIVNYIGNGYYDNLGYTQGYQDGFEAGMSDQGLISNSSAYDEGRLAGYNIGYSSGLIEGASSGIQVGYSSGYQVGYGSGYNQGEADYSQGNPYSVFTVIGQAFNTMSSILGIDLLPGLSIGVLLFTPIIILVTIIIFKMFKG